jgi:outer membrane lipoprotein-sorting protein
MNGRIAVLASVLMSMTSSAVDVVMPSGGEESHSTESKAILAEVQQRLNNARSFSMTAVEEKGGVKFETKSVVKQHGRGVVSCRQEQRAVVPDAMPPPFVSIIDHNKIYFFPTGCGDIAVRMKYLESREPNSPVANLFFAGGACEKVGETHSECLIRYTCTTGEVLALKAAIEKKLGTTLKKDMAPAVIDYKVAKDTRTLLEATVYSERGKLIDKKSFRNWQFDVEISDSTFEIPKGFKLHVVKSAKEAGRLQAELMKKAIEEQVRKQQQDKKRQKR